MNNEWMPLLRFTSALILFASIIVTWIAVRRLRASTATYNARLLPFAYYSLISWLCLLINYILLGLMTAGYVSQTVVFAVFTAQRFVGSLGTAFLFLAVVALHSRRPHRPRVAVTIALSLWLVTASFLSLLPPGPFGTYWVVFSVFDALLLWSVIPAVVRLRMNWLYAAPFALYGVLQLLWQVSPSAWAVLASVGVIARAALLLVWNRLIVMVLSRATRSYSSAVSKIEALDFIPGLRRPFQVMISSTVDDLRQERDAAEQAVTALHLSRFRAETFGSLPHTPRAICEFMARSCDLMILVVGERYGHIIEPERISVVEFEYTVARAADPRKILVYVKAVSRSDERLLTFLREVEDFERGYFRSGFETAEQLYERIHVDIAHWLAARAVEIPGGMQPNHGMQPTC